MAFRFAGANVACSNLYHAVGSEDVNDIVDYGGRSVFVALREGERLCYK